MADVEFEYVDSSNLLQVGWDEETETLYIQFKSGGLYSYEAVPEAVYIGLLTAASKGRYFWSNIRDIYPYQRIG
jgi:hypothetical protein